MMSEFEMMTQAKRDATRSKSTVAALRNERMRMANAFVRIQEAAHDGQNGSAAYALDRLALIQAVATTALHRLED